MRLHTFTFSKSIFTDFERKGKGDGERNIDVRVKH